MPDESRDVRSVLPLTHAFEVKPGHTYLVAVRGEMLTPADVAPLASMLKALDVNAAVFFMRDGVTLEVYETTTERALDDADLEQLGERLRTP